ncbi:hypothetical protein [Bordetella trematum]|uniref:hypothetical protein n=1 Tax=Bordetella trematum TaxID=123899 RepID=UPI000D8CBA8F|nr:hypothetical protein [Bordetella trematum]SPU54109.1 Uncharacterised protein [Bordetella trematum]VDH08124.1 Uncharacterised protein [Bordetella trematum]
MAISPLGGSPFISPYSREKTATADSRNDDPVQQTLRELQQQLREVMRQMQRIRDSNLPPAQKTQQLQMLNSQAASLQGQIQKILAAQLRQLQAQG